MDENLRQLEKRLETNFSYYIQVATLKRRMGASFRDWPLPGDYVSGEKGHDRVVREITEDSIIYRPQVGVYWVHLDGEFCTPPAWGKRMECSKKYWKRWCRTLLQVNYRCLGPPGKAKTQVEYEEMYEVVYGIFS